MAFNLKVFNTNGKQSLKLVTFIYSGRNDSETFMGARLPRMITVYTNHSKIDFSKVIYFPLIMK